MADDPLLQAAETLAAKVEVEWDEPGAGGIVLGGERVINFNVDTDWSDTWHPVINEQGQAFIDSLSRLVQEREMAYECAQRLETHALTALYEAAGGDFIVTRKTCGTCGGSGTVEIEKQPREVVRPCGRCGGTGAQFLTDRDERCRACYGTGEALTLEQQDPREPCPDCVDGKLPTEVIKVKPIDNPYTAYEGMRAWTEVAT